MTTRDHLDQVGAQPPLWAPLAVIAGALAVTAAGVGGSPYLLELAFLVTAGLTLALAHRVLLSWTGLLCGILLVILFVPIRRYTLPGGLPFELEPYRLLVAVAVVGWGASLLVDRRVTLRRTGFEAPIALILIGVLGSLAANPGRVSSLGSDVTKEVTFLASFLLLVYLIVSVVRGRRTIDTMIHVLVLGGAVVAVFALIESRADWNAFNQLGRVFPFLDAHDLPGQETRGGRLRVFGSAQHPIALGAAFAMLLPLAVYLARRSGRRIWWIPAALITLGVFSTVSRTSIVMLLVVGLVVFRLRSWEVRRFIVPALIVLPLLVHVALPGTLGSLKKSFFPEGGLVADQQKAAGQRGSGRISDLGPALSELKSNPFVGQGYGTRVIDLERANAQILDNQWLKTLLETGVLGFVGWFWFLAAVIRRMGRAAKEDRTTDGWLYVALAASVLAFGVGMLTYDAFSFIQVTFLMFILVAIATCSLHARRESEAEPASLSRPARKPLDG